MSTTYVERLSDSADGELIVVKQEAMSTTYVERLSDSPFVTNYSWSVAESDGVNVLPADGNSYMFLQKHEGKPTIAIGGPLTKAIHLPIRAGTEWVGVRFRLGTFMPRVPPGSILDDVAFLPSATSNSFWLNDSTWQHFDFDNVDVFVERLIRDGALVRDPVVEAVMQEQPPTMSLRSLQRRFLQVTGMTYNAIQQIERARRAVTLLHQGLSIIDAAHQLGYYDQPHLTNSLKRFFGQTPAQIARLGQPE